ncbi:MAG: FAD:protein FMN transferase [Bacteroidetes bacterium]|nr:FAD:protein FMN transferase [Bacteroidota bacterium]
MNFYYPAVIFLSTLLVFTFSSCKDTGYRFYEGFAEGTTFHISYQSDSNYNEQISQLLGQFEKSLSTFDSGSIISRINRNDTTVIPDEYFIKFFKKSSEIAEATDGAFDITVAPLVNAWGFGFSEMGTVSDSLIDSLLQFVGMDKVSLVNDRIRKKDTRVMLDGSAIAKGFSVDIIGDFLSAKGIKNFMVEIGGEVVARGKNMEGKLWRIGIDKPVDDPYAINRELQAIVELKDKAVATSGNYRRFRIENGIKLSHTINPKTGYPAGNELLSVTIMAEDCITADAWATACMVTGLEKSIRTIENNPGLNAFFIYSDEQGQSRIFMTEGLKKSIIE